jgi:hypothetical protein
MKLDPTGPNDVGVVVVVVVATVVVLGCWSLVSVGRPTPWCWVGLHAAIARPRATTEPTLAHILGDALSEITGAPLLRASTPTCRWRRYRHNAIVRFAVESPCRWVHGEKIGERELGGTCSLALTTPICGSRHAQYPPTVPNRAVAVQD